MTCDYIQPSLSAYFNLTLFLVIDTLIGWHIFAFTLKKEFLYNFNHLANSLLESNSAQFSIDGNLLLLSMLSVSINDPFNQFNPLTQLLPCKISNTVQKVSDLYRCSTKYIRFLSMIYCCQQKKTIACYLPRVASTISTSWNVRGPFLQIFFPEEKKLLQNPR